MCRFKSLVNNRVTSYSAMVSANIKLLIFAMPLGLTWALKHLPNHIIQNSSCTLIVYVQENKFKVYMLYSPQPKLNILNESAHETPESPQQDSLIFGIFLSPPDEISHSTQNANYNHHLSSST